MSIRFGAALASVAAACLSASAAQAATYFVDNFANGNPRNNDAGYYWYYTQMTSNVPTYHSEAGGLLVYSVQHTNASEATGVNNPPDANIKFPLNSSMDSMKISVRDVDFTTTNNNLRFDLGLHSNNGSFYSSHDGVQTRIEYNPTTNLTNYRFGYKVNGANSDPLSGPVVNQNATGEISGYDLLVSSTSYTFTVLGSALPAEGLSHTGNFATAFSSTNWGAAVDGGAVGAAFRLRWQGFGTLTDTPTLAIGSITVESVAVPEPGLIAFAALAGCALLRRRSA